MLSRRRRLVEFWFSCAGIISVRDLDFQLLNLFSLPVLNFSLLSLCVV